MCEDIGFFAILRTRVFADHLRYSCLYTNTAPRWGTHNSDTCTMIKIHLAFLLCLSVIVVTDAFVQHHPTRISHSWSFARRMSVSTSTDRDQKVQEVLSIARQQGPIGAFTSQEDQDSLLEMAKKLSDYSDPDPSTAPYRGVHDLVYSSSSGQSSGLIAGPIYGKVTQTFLDDNETFINSVMLGPLTLALRATRKFADENTNQVMFRQVTIQLFGNTVLEKDITGGGTWNYLFHGTIEDTDGTSKLVRIMEAPSLFIIEQPQ